MSTPSLPVLLDNSGNAIDTTGDRALTFRVRRRSKALSKSAIEPQTLRRISASILVLSLLFVVRIFGNDFAIFPNVNRRAVHARNLPSGPCSPPQTATHTRGKAFCLLRYFTSSGHGPCSSNNGDFPKQRQ
jgi:hypothetical protein